MSSNAIVNIAGKAKHAKPPKEFKDPDLSQFSFVDEYFIDAHTHYQAVFHSLRKQDHAGQIEYSPATFDMYVNFCIIVLLARIYMIYSNIHRIILIFIHTL